MHSTASLCSGIVRNVCSCKKLITCENYASEHCWWAAASEQHGLKQEIAQGIACAYAKTSLHASASFLSRVRHHFTGTSKPLFKPQRSQCHPPLAGAKQHPVAKPYCNNLIKRISCSVFCIVCRPSSPSRGRAW